MHFIAHSSRVHDPFHFLAHLAEPISYVSNRRIADGAEGIRTKCTHLAEPAYTKLNSLRPPRNEDEGRKQYQTTSEMRSIEEV